MRRQADALYTLFCISMTIIVCYNDLLNNLIKLTGCSNARECQVYMVAVNSKKIIIQFNSKYQKKIRISCLIIVQSATTQSVFFYQVRITMDVCKLQPLLYWLFV